MVMMLNNSANNATSNYLLEPFLFSLIFDCFQTQKGLQCRKKYNCIYLKMITSITIDYLIMLGFIKQTNQIIQ